MVLKELPETRGGGVRNNRNIAGAYEKAVANPGMWVLASLDEVQTGARNFVLRKHPDVLVATRKLEHNSEGRITVFIMYNP